MYMEMLSRRTLNPIGVWLYAYEITDKHPCVQIPSTDRDAYFCLGIFCS